MDVAKILALTLLWNVDLAQLSEVVTENGGHCVAGWRTCPCGPILNVCTIEESFGRAWCATEVDPVSRVYTNWDWCDQLMNCKCMTESKKACHSFEYDGDFFGDNVCTYKDSPSGRPWCATEVNVTGLVGPSGGINSNWDYCNSNCGVAEGIPSECPTCPSCTSAANLTSAAPITSTMMTVTTTTTTITTTTMAIVTTTTTATAVKDVLTYTTGKVFLFGSLPTAANSDFSKSEIVDVASSGTKICPPVPDHPTITYGASGTYINKKVLLCGGTNADGYASSACSNYNPATNTWSDAGVSLAIARWGAASVLLSPTEWWVTGGLDADLISSTELYNIGANGTFGSFNSYPDLPVGSYLHSLVRINATKVMLLGGFVDNQAWMFDRGTQIWTTLPNMNEARTNVQAGLLTYDNGNLAVVACGGDSSVTCEMFDLTSWSWKSGIIPSLPHDASISGYQGMMASTYGGNTLVMGCFLDDSNGVHKQIYSYRSGAGNWTTFANNTIYEHIMSPSFLVPDDFVTCI